MAYRKRTLRGMSPVTRKTARLIGELESVTRRLKNIIPEIRSLELDSRALQSMNNKEIDSARRETEETSKPIFPET